MFETLFTYPGALRRHSEGPLSAERASYLGELAAQGMALGTILRRASYCLRVAEELLEWPQDHCFDQQEVASLAAAWAARRYASGHASSAKWPELNFRPVASDFLRSIGRLRSPARAVGFYEHELADFIATRQEGRWSSDATCRSATWQVSRFFVYLDQRDIALADVVPSDIDVYFELAAQRGWSRNSLRTCAKMLRAWFAHCEERRWIRRAVSKTIMLPRMYQHEGLPIGPTWQEVGHILADTVGEDPASLRDHAIILLLSVYGLRSGELRRLQLDDIDWSRHRIRVVRSKSRREETLPLEPRVGNAIAQYLRRGRPKVDSRTVFVTLRARHRPLSSSGLYNVVKHLLSKFSSPMRKGRGPHSLRHACARHLLESGRTFKEVGDHLGHRSSDATRHYAKVDLASLRRVALEDFGGLT